ncbi:MAG: glucose-6-phosphate isomerase [Rhizobiaceae bacterium]|nr:glucose-6-phosphate isomerase [Rhizobiaceae bacterium]
MVQSNKNDPLADCYDHLSQHWGRLKDQSMRQMFADDPNRFDNMSLRLENLLFDFSKTCLDEPAIGDLAKLAQSGEVEAKRDRMFAGHKINATEGRAVLHTALRASPEASVLVDGENVVPQVLAVLSRMAEFSDAVRAGEYLVSGNRVTDIVNIGIGGSDLGPNMVASALLPYCDGPKVHFISNIDGADIIDTLDGLDPTATLFIVASKTFTTQETMTNAATAMNWVRETVGKSAEEHFCAVSTNLQATQSFGIPDERTFGFWDWVGGRYSVWSAIGLPVMIAIGADAFHEFLDGGRLADEHFRSAPVRENIPIMMALLGIWHRNVCEFPAMALLPYDNRLAHFPRWLQQLDMESNGKGKTHDGEQVSGKTGPVVFGEPGTNGQHAFYQLLHQGTEVIPCDFLVAARGHEAGLDHQHRLLIANCFAQSEALMKGQTLEEAEGNPHRVFPGNRPSCTFVYPSLDPKTLGMLMAFYEHKVFVQGVIWNVNSFDQFGVELGKQLGKSIEKLIEGETSDGADNGSTKGLLKQVFTLRKR